MKDGLVHLGSCGGNHFAPCGAQVSALAATLDERGKYTSYHDEVFTIELQSSCGDDLARVTCPHCMAYVAKLVRLYREATRKATKWSELPTGNIWRKKAHG